MPAPSTRSRANFRARPGTPPVTATMRSTMQRLRNERLLRNLRASLARSKSSNPRCICRPPGRRASSIPISKFIDFGRPDAVPIRRESRVVSQAADCAGSRRRSPASAPEPRSRREDVPRVSQTGSIVDDASRARVLEAYAAEHLETFRSRDDVSLDEAAAVLVRLRDAFAEKLEYVSIADQVEIPMFFGCASSRNGR